jgi:uncharacterized membrane protein YgaE (UPF0421/DUF939 family)
VLSRLEAPLKGLGPVVLQAAKTAIAAGLAWFIAADVIGNNLPVFAPLSALLTVQVTVWDSVSRGLQRALGVVVGVLVAYALARLMGIHVWSVALVVFVSWVAGQLLRLGQQGAVQVPVSALLVLVLGTTTSGYAIDRVIDTFIGAAVGVGASLIVIPRTNLAEARASVRALATAVVEVLRGLGSGVLAPGGDFQALLTKARRLDDVAESAAVVTERTLTATRWSPTGYRDRSPAQALVTALNTLDYVVRSTRGLARVLTDGQRGSQLPPDLAEPLADLLRTAADELEAWAGGINAGQTVPHEPDAARVAQKYQAVLAAARSAGVTAEVTAMADAVAIYGLRITEDLQAVPDQEAPTTRAGWRSLFGH